GVGSLAGNRLAELLINYYSLAWLDRHLQGRLVFDDAGNVVTSDGRTEAEERAYRQAQAQDAFDRLTAMVFDDSVDIHNISMGFYDPVQHATSGDPLYGGNVPYSIEGLWVTDRLAQEYRSFCSVSVPDYVGGSDGGPGSPVAAAADSGADGDIRFTGCRSAKSVTGSALTLEIEGRGGNRTLVAGLSVADDPSSGIAGRTIDFSVDGIAIGSATTDGEGIATLTVPPKYRGRSHTFEAIFAGDGEYSGSEAETNG
ncbi:MAG: Ig-like domain-containing protein, partial [Actinomycetota bacterium]